eukprot:746772-Hanusia_phi.AAC.2
MQRDPLVLLLKVNAQGVAVDVLLPHLDRARHGRAGGDREAVSCVGGGEEEEVALLVSSGPLQHVLLPPACEGEEGAHALQGGEGDGDPGRELEGRGEASRDVADAEGAGQLVDLEDQLEPRLRAGSNGSYDVCLRKDVQLSTSGSLHAARDQPGGRGRGGAGSLGEDDAVPDREVASCEEEGRREVAGDGDEVLGGGRRYERGLHSLDADGGGQSAERPSCCRRNADRDGRELGSSREDGEVGGGSLVERG